MSLSVSSGTSLITAGAVYVKATWFETISSGTAGTITGLPAGGTIVLDAMGGGVDAVVSGIANGVPDYTAVKTSGGTTVTTTFDEDGNYVLSGTPSSYPVAVVYIYRIQLAKFDYTKTISDLEFTGTLGVESLNGLNGVLSIVEGEGIDVATGSNTITVSGENASTSNKGIASFDSGNFSVSSGAVNTIQDIDSGASPTFSGLTIPALTAGRVVFSGSSNQLQVDSKLIWDNTNGELEIRGATGSNIQLQISSSSGSYDDATMGISAVGGTGRSKINLYAGAGTIPRAQTIDFYSGNVSLLTPRWQIGNDRSSNGIYNFTITNATAAQHLTFTQTGLLGINTVPSQILDMESNGTDNYVRIAAGGTSSNYSGIMFTERLINFGHNIRYDAATDVLEFGHQDNTPTFTPHATIDASGNWEFSGTLNFSGGASGASPTPQITIDNYIDNAGSPSVSHVQLYTNYGFGISTNTLNYISDQDHKFYDGTVELVAMLAGGKLNVNSPSGSTYNTNINGDIHAGSSYDGGQYGTYNCTEALTRSNNKFSYSAVAAGNEIIGLGYIDGTTTWKLGRTSTASARGLINNSSDNWGFDMVPESLGGANVIQIKNGTAPTSNPTGGIALYSEGNAGKARGGSGTVTTWAPADPHCDECGMDYMLEFENPAYDMKYLSVCVACLSKEFGSRKWIRTRKPEHGSKD